MVKLSQWQAINLLKEEKKRGVDTERSPSIKIIVLYRIIFLRREARRYALACLHHHQHGRRCIVTIMIMT